MIRDSIKELILPLCEIRKDGKLFVDKEKLLTRSFKFSLDEIKEKYEFSDSISHLIVSILTELDNVESVSFQFLDNGIDKSGGV